MDAILNIVLVFLGGGVGALSRYGITNLGILDHNKYIYTVFINLTGCMIIGILWALFNHWNLSRNWYLFAITGLLGGYTTYSAFSLDAMLLVQNGEWLKTLLYVAITVVGGLGFCALGLFLTERLLK